MRSKRATGDPVKPGAGGLRGPDRQQEGLRDRRGGAADNIVPQSEKPMREHRTPHEDAQPGSAIQPETEAPDEGTPERLRRMEDPDRIIKQAVKDAQHTLTVNGASPVTVNYPNTGWETWRQAPVNVTLNAGANTVRLTRLTRWAELDYIEVA